LRTLGRVASLARVRPHLLVPGVGCAGISGAWCRVAGISGARGLCGSGGPCPHWSFVGGPHRAYCLLASVSSGRATKCTPFPPSGGEEGTLAVCLAGEVVCAGWGPSGISSGVRKFGTGGRVHASLLLTEGGGVHFGGLPRRRDGGIQPAASRGPVFGPASLRPARVRSGLFPPRGALGVRCPKGTYASFGSRLKLVGPQAP